ncbi:MAG TPA: right-handed parallel beta-helix repeat-containing protein [Pseudonocardiaceae bacterium]|nr:right-handed parallel beta-helix repeat-containing protein [Pseudonocardiaceae bacterium]
MSRLTGPRGTVAAMAAVALCTTGMGVGGLALAAPASAAPAPVNFFVAPGGSDGNQGTSAASPFQTLAKAQSAVRAVDQSTAGPITVNLAGGDYRLTAPLAFTAADSGTNGTITWQAEAGAFPVISGGAQLTGWKQVNAGKNIWAAPAPSGLATRQLYVNGTRATRATGALPVSVKQTATGYTTSSGDPMASWTNQSQVEFVYKGGLGAWTEPRCPVASITSTTITMAQPCWNNSTKRVMRTDGSGRTVELVGRQSITEAPTSVENAMPLLDTPGEWYLDGSSHQVFYIPRSGENLASADVEAASLSTLMSLQGSTSAHVHSIAFQGIQFSYATNTIPNTPTGFSEIQATYTITGSNGFAVQGLCTFVSGGTCPYGAWTKMAANVSLTSDDNITFDHDYFVHLGGAGLDIGNDSQHDTVTANVFTDISGNGLDVGGVDQNNPPSAQQVGSITVQDSHFFNTSAEYHGGVAIDIGYVKNSTFAHNQIDHTPYTGISVGWGGWPDKVKLPAEPNFSHANNFTDNLIFNVMSDLSDGGGIYTQGITGTSLATGEHVTGNIVHDNIATAGHGLYTDNGATFVTLTGNAEYNIHSNVWGSNHVNYTLNNGTDDPLDIENNWWTNGPANMNSKSVLIQNNHNITSPSQIPASIVSAAGIESGSTGILSWKPAK